MTRVVLLGASNIAIGFPLIVRTLLSGLPRPLSISAAFGHGRSYCAWSRVLFRGLPGIGQCGLWDDLTSPSGGDVQTLALLTDIGNDLIYGVSPVVIARRVEDCMLRLASHHAEIVVTRLPLQSIARLSALRFHATKAVFFPRTGGTWAKLLADARELDDRVCELAERTAARLIDQPLNWYGFDPIHIRRRRRSSAWRTIFSGWPSFQTQETSRRLPLPHSIRLRLAPPSERRLFGRAHWAPQPSLMLDDVAIRLY